MGDRMDRIRGGLRTSGEVAAHVPEVFRRAADLIETRGWWNGTGDRRDTLDVSHALHDADPEFCDRLGNGRLHDEFLAYLHTVGHTWYCVSQWNDIECGDQPTAVATLRKAADWYLNPGGIPVNGDG